jgi:hypothetical protein
MQIVIGKPVDQQYYLSITGSFSYAALGTRPDIAFIVANLARYNTDPRSVHLTAAKRVLQYLKKTKHLQLHFDPNPPDSFREAAGLSWKITLYDRGAAPPARREPATSAGSRPLLMQK